MDRILFGDNQFFGVNHMSEERARAQSMQFQDINAIIDVLDIALDEGVKTFMCTTHERVLEICDHVRQNPDRYANYQFYPCMPYAHKYANAATEHGILGALKLAIPEGKAVNTILKGGMSLARKDIDGLVRLLVDAEMKMFAGLSTPVIFLQNVVTDLLVGIGMKDALKSFYNYVSEKYNAEPGFITMNLPLLLDVLDDLGIENPIVCANINRIGFRMSGGKSVYEETLKNRIFRPVAMSILASGAIPAEDAVKYICDQPDIESIVFGASGKANIQQTVALINHYS